MCSFLGVDMENYQGDLTDIVRGTAGSDVSAPPAWQFPSDPVNFSSSGMDDPSVVDSSFGDPFSAMSIDPLLDELAVAGSPGYFIAPAAPVVEDSFCPESSSNNVVSGSNNISMLGTHKIFEDDTKSPPCNILSRIQISPSGKQMGVSPRDSPAMVSPRGVKAPAVVAGNMINGGSSEGCLIDGTGPVQISSPRNLGIKRRKNQAKKVVCIPAPAAANSRSSGEVVPSDLWAWRKYGQKPIKGSPYPRGYYRCSSSKGCSARKQVERSRTDPNMLVITYTSEHNHPWPTQRNALAGSTRSQPSKGNAAGKKDETPTKESSSDGADLSPTIAGGGTCASVKEEGADDTQNKEMELENPELDFSGGGQGYRPELISADESGHQHQDDLFAGLDVIEADPLNLLFSGDDEPSARQKGLDPFSIFDWSGEIKRNLSP